MLRQCELMCGHQATGQNGMRKLSELPTTGATIATAMTQGGLQLRFSFFKTYGAVEIPHFFKSRCSLNTSGTFIQVPDVNKEILRTFMNLKKSKAV